MMGGIMVLVGITEMLEKTAAFGKRELTPLSPQRHNNSNSFIRFVI